MFIDVKDACVTLSYILTMYVWLTNILVIIQMYMKILFIRQIMKNDSERSIEAL